MLQTLNFSGPRMVNIAATFFKYESGSAGGSDESIRVRADGADLGIYYPGDSVEIPETRISWEIFPTSQNCNGVLRVGVGRVMSARLSGTVQVIDGGKSRSMAQMAGIGTAAQGVSAGNYSFVQLWNPASSTKNIFVRKIVVSSTGNQGFILTMHTAAVGASSGAAVSKLNQLVTPYPMQKGVSPSVIGQNVMFNLVTPGAAFTVDFQEPIVVGPGYGLVLHGGAPGMDIYGTFDFFAE